MSARDTEALQRLIDESVDRLAPRIAEKLHMDAAQGLAVALEHPQRQNISKELAEDIICPAIAAATLKRLSDMCLVTANEWRGIYTTNRDRFFTDEWFVS